MADRKPLVQVSGQMQEIPASDILVLPAVKAGVYEVGDVCNIGSGSAPWLFLGSLPISGSGASTQLLVQMLGGDWADSGLATYSISSFGQTTSSTSIPVRILDVAYTHSSAELYSGVEFKAFRDAANTKVDIYARVAGDYVATGMLVYERTTYSVEIVQSVVATLPTVGVTELTVNFGWMPSNELASTLLLRNSTLARNTLFDITDPTQVASIDYNGSRVAFPAKIQAPAATVNSASLRILQGVTPTAPGLGDVWSDGAYIYWRNTSAADRTLVQTAGLTTGAIPKTTGSGILADGLLSDTGTEIRQASGLARYYNPNLTDNVIAFTCGTAASPDSVSAFVMRMDGLMGWGAGGVTARDTNLYRASANVLKTDDTFEALNLRAIDGTVRVERASSTNDAYIASVTGDAVNRFMMRANGQMYWGDGTNPRDVTLYRSAADVLKTDDNFDVGIDLRVAGTPRITAGGAATMATVSAANLVDGQIVHAAASGLLRSDAGLVYVRTNNISRLLTLGDGAVTANVAIRSRRSPGYFAAHELIDEFDVSRWAMRLPAVGEDFELVARNGSDIDKPIVIGNASASAITLGGASNRPVVLTSGSRLRFATDLDFYRAGDSSAVHFKVPSTGTRALIPETTTTANNAALGTPSYRWRGVYADVADFSGSITGGSVVANNLTPGRVTFAGAGDVLSDDSSFLFDSVKKDFGVGVDRTIAGSTSAVSEAAEILIASGQYMNGLYELRFDHTNRVERLWVRINAQSYFDQPTITVVQYFSYLSSNCFGTIRVRRSADSATMYITVTVSNLNGGTGGINVVAKLLDAAAPTGLTIGGTLPGSTVSLRALTPDSTLAYKTSAGAEFGGSVLGQSGFNAYGTTSVAAYWHIGQGAHIADRVALASKASGDNYSRYLIKEAGLMEWGDGTNVRDTNLYRGGVSLLQSDDILMTGGGFRATGYFATAVDGTGPGVEVHYDSVNSRARVMGYDRTASARIQLAIDGSPINFYANGTLKGSFNSTGDFNIVNLTAGRIVYTVSTGGLRVASKLQYSGGDVLVMGDGTADASITLNKLDAGTGAFRFQVAGVERGSIGIDASENFFWESKNSSGVVIDKPISWVNSAGGAMSIVRPLTVSAALTVTGTTTLATSLTGLLKATSGVVAAATAADVTGQLLTGYVVGANTALAATDSILGAFGKVQGQINARPTGTGSTNHVAVWSSASTLTHVTNFSFTTSVSNILNVGSNEAKSSYIDISTGTSNEAMNRYYANFVQRWGAGRNASNEYEISAYNFSGVLIDKPIVIANASAGLISIGGSTARPTTFSGLVTASAGLDVGTSSQSWIRNGGGGLYMGYGSDKADYRFYCYGNTAGFASMSSGSHVAGVAATTVGGTSGLVTVYGDVLKVEYLAGTGTRALAVDQYGQLVVGSGGSNIQNLGLSPTYSPSMDGTQKVVFTVPSTTFTAEGQKIVSNFQFDTNYSAGASRTYEIYYGSKRVAKFTHSPGTSGVRATAKVTLFPIGIGASSVMHCAVEITANGTSTGIAALSDTDLDAYVLVYTSGNLSVATGYWTANNVNTGATASMSFRATGPTATNVGVEGPTAQFIG